MLNSTQDAKVRKIIATSTLLKAKFGKLENWVADDPLDSLVAVILSQNTSDANSWPAFQALKKRFPNWEQLLTADTKIIARTIRSGGLANIKAKRIKSVLREIKQKRGKLDLSFLSQLPTPQAREFLLSLNGVGPKSAAVVLNFAFNRPTFPVDTHVYRVSQRLGLIDSRVSREKAHELMEELVPDKEKRSYHVNLIRLGRKVCIARNPRCSQCPLQKHCNYYGEFYLPQQRNERKSGSLAKGHD